MSVYDIVTERIIKQLEAGTAPWHKPWTTTPAQNFVSRKAYRGINVFLLSGSGFASPYWLTFKQAAGLGGSVRKGEHGSLVVFWKMLDKVKQDADTPDEKRSKFAMLRYYTVFNVEQCDGLEIPAAGPSVPTLEAAEAIVSGYKDCPLIRGDAQRAAYSPQLDVVGIPARDSFKDSPSYYSTLFHELSHSTGHQSRLNRPGVTDTVNFGSDNYSREELVAEMGAAMLCGHAGLVTETVEQSAAYLKHWIGVLKGDSKLVVMAAAAAQKSSDYILNGKAVQS